MTPIQCNPIAHIETDLPTKFGVPRQSGLVAGLKGRIVFEPAFRQADALRGLEGFSHLWVLWVFHHNASPTSESIATAQAGSPAAGQAFRATVRPPRLGGNVRMGVFATRSPFRPNPIGLSAVRIERIEPSTPRGPIIHVGGIDMADGTPIIDLKPYLPMADAIVDATEGFAAATRQQPPLTVVIPDDVRSELARRYGFDGTQTDVLCQLLQQDPRPHVQHDGQRLYGLPYAGADIRFRVDGTTLTVVAVVPAAPTSRQV